MLDAFGSVKHLLSQLVKIGISHGKCSTVLLACGFVSRSVCHISRPAVDVQICAKQYIGVGSLG